MDLIDKLREIVGDRVSAAPSEMLCYSSDASQVKGMPDCAVRPLTTAEVSAVVGLAADLGVAVTARGAGTGLAGGAVPLRAGPTMSRPKAGVEVEVLSHPGHPQHLSWAFAGIGVVEDGSRALGGKVFFRALYIRGITSMETIVIQQEMLARGGDAAIPMGALRCDPGEMEVLVLGTVAAVRGLAKNLSGQPFNLSAVAGAIEDALDRVADPKRYW